MYYAEAEVEVTVTSAEELRRKAELGGKAPKGRVVFVAAPGNSSNNYHVTRNYATHAETWVIVKCSEGFKPTTGCKFSGREGNWYCLWHEFHHTSQQADEDYAVHVRDYGRMDVWFNQVIL
jgi:hypothetical protein